MSNVDFLAIVKESRTNPFVFRCLIQFLRTFETSLLEKISSDSYKFHEHSSEMCSVFNRIQCNSTKILVISDFICALFSSIEAHKYKLKLILYENGKHSLIISGLEDDGLRQDTKFWLMLRLGTNVTIAEWDKYSNALYLSVVRHYLEEFIIPDLADIVVSYSLLPEVNRRRKMTRY